MGEAASYLWMDCVNVNYKHVSLSPLQLAMSIYLFYLSKYADSRLHYLCFLLSKDLAVSVSLSISLSVSLSVSLSLSVYQIKESLSWLAFCITMCINVVNICLSLTIYPRPSVNNVYLWLVSPSLALQFHIHLVPLHLFILSSPSSSAFLL